MKYTFFQLKGGRIVRADYYFNFDNVLFIWHVKFKAGGNDNK